MQSSNANVSGSDPATTFPCPLCDEPLAADTFECTKCDWVSGYRHRVPVTSGSARDFAAAGLSIVPGLGHLFKGHVKSGIAFMAGTAVMVFFIGAMGMVAMGFQLLLLPFYWLFVMVQAFMTTDLRADDTIPAHIG